MILLHLPWLEIAIGICIVGALLVSRLHDPILAARGGLAFTGFAFLCTFVAWLGEYLGVSRSMLDEYSFQHGLFGGVLFELDELNAPLVPAVALLHFLMAVATARTKMRRFSFSWSLGSEAIRLAAFACQSPWVLIGLLIADAFPGYLELVNRNRPTRVYALHMLLFSGLLIAGWAGVEAGQSHGDHDVPWAICALLIAILIRCGTVPAHCWLTDWFEHASFGIAILFVAPLAGVYAAMRLVVPIAPEWVLTSLAFASLITAVYAAAMATVQKDARRFFAYLFLSHSSLVLVGLELVGQKHGALSLTGALCLWFSVLLSLGGFGLTLRALEARFGRLSLTDYYGLYDHSPTLAVCFLLTGLASVGFPGTLGFISAELLIDGAVEVSPTVGLVVVAAAALNGIAVVRAYFLLFTGTRHAGSVTLWIGMRERFAVLTLAGLILGGGLFPQPGVKSRFRAAEEALARRAKLFPPAHDEVHVAAE